MSVFKRGKTWSVQVSLHDENGKRKYKTKGGFKRRIDAIDWEQRMSIQIREDGPLSTNGISFGMYFEEWFKTFKKSAVSYNTQLKYQTSQRSIDSYFKRKPLKDITKTQYQKFLNNYADDGYGHTHAKQSVQKLHIHAHQAVLQAIDDGLLKKDFALNPIISGQPSKKESLKFLEADDFERLQDYVNHFAEPSNKSLLMIQTAIYSGARLSEIAGLTFDDIDEDNQTISINKSYDYVDSKVFKPTKTESSNRAIDVSPTLIKSLHTLILTQKINAATNPNSLVFAKSDGVPPTSNSVNKVLRTILKRLDIKKPEFTFHGIRHSHASYLLANGIELQYVSKRLGHDNIGITSRVYAHILSRFEKEQAQKAINILERNEAK